MASRDPPVVPLLLLLLLAVGVGAATRSGSAPPAFVTRLVQSYLGDAPLLTANECPGVADGVCGRPCQLRICGALAAFFRVSNNASDPWDQEDGWATTTKASCQQLVAAGSTGRSRPAPYCSWYGVLCCTPPLLADGKCRALNTIAGLGLASNNLNVSLQNPVFFGAVKTLHDCGMTALNLESNNLIDSLDSGWGQLVHLQLLNLGCCWINGTIPDSLRQLRNLTFINLSNNWLHGSLPTWLSELPNLRVLSLGSQAGANPGSNLTGMLGHFPKDLGKLQQLRELNLAANSLTGVLPSGLCKAGEASPLLVLNVRDNLLEGGAEEVQECLNLVQLDLSRNNFTGSLPTATSWRKLTTYTASFNSFSGRLPQRLSEARVLEYLDIGHNSLTGLIPTQVTLISSLKSVIMSHNMLSGTVSEDLYYLPALAVVDLSNNQLVGTTPVAIGLSLGLAELDLSNNPGLTGMIPAVMGRLAKLRMVKASNTSMSCAGIIKPYNVTTNNSCTDPLVCLTPQLFGNESTVTERCPQDQLLPCFLRFSDYFVPRNDASNMRCRVIIRKPLEQAQQACTGDGPGRLGDQVGDLADTPTDRWLQRWEVDPAYYQYQACQCLLGYSEVWDSTGTELTCELAKQNNQTTAIIIAVAVSSVAVLLVALVLWRQYLTTRPRWLRERVLQAKRSKGAPKAGKPGERVRVSIVVTDVQDFSELTRRYPELMNKAMGGHNGIMRKGCHAHAGYVLDQEGDSWTIAFHDAEDAVAFSLQVQQALQHKVWNMRVACGDTSHRGPHLGGAAARSMRMSDTNSAASSYDFMMGASPAAAPSAEGDSATGLSPVAGSSARRLHASFSATSDDGGCADKRASHGDGSFTAAAGAGGPGAGALPWPSDHAPPSALGGSTGGVLGPHARELQGKTGASGKQQGAADADDTWPVRDASQPPHATYQQQQQHEQEQLDNGSFAHRRSRLPWLLSWGGSSTAQSRTNSIASRMPSSVLPPVAPVHGESSGSGSLSVWQHSPTTSRLFTAGSALMRRLSHIGRVNMGGPHMLLPVTAVPQEVQELQLLVRIGIATGLLPYGCDINNCAVKDRAKAHISDAANGGQVLMDERTFKLVKHSLSALGTVDENGYNDKQLQQLLQAHAVARLQRRMACCRTACVNPSSADSFGNGDAEVLPQDYDTDAIVVHMGGFSVPVTALPGTMDTDKDNTGHDSSSGSTTPSEDGSGDERRVMVSPAASLTAAGTAGGGRTSEAAAAAGAATDGHPAAPALAAAAAAAAAARRARPGRTSTAGAAARRGAAAGVGVGVGRQHMQMHLYSIAAPKMRVMAPQQSSEPPLPWLSWSAPLRLKPGWAQFQKGYFEAPGARCVDLAPSTYREGPICPPALPLITFVFAEVAGAHLFAHKRHRSERHALNKSIRRCMLQLQQELPGGDGYLCRCHEADLKYMVAFESPVRAVQWCLLVQEALMYIEWPQRVLEQPGFEEVVDASSGLPLFRGPRIRMGLSEGPPSNMLPDHIGFATYTGGPVNCAARFMDAAAHPGQVVCDLDLARRCFTLWDAHNAAAADAAAAAAATPVAPPGSGGRSSWGSGLGGHGPTRDTATPSGLPGWPSRLSPSASEDQASLMQFATRSMSETSGHCQPASRPQSFRSRIAHDLWSQQQLQQLQQLQSWKQQHRQWRQPPVLREGQPAALGGLERGPPGSGLHPLEGQQQQQQQQLELSSSFSRQHGADVPASGESFSRQQLRSPAHSFSSRRSGDAAAVGAAAALPRHHPPPLRLGAPAGGAVARSGRGDAFASAAAAAAAAAASSVSEEVSVSHIGSFVFKGSGVYEMVQLCHPVLLSREFPREAPRGKGARLSVATGDVAGLQQVQLHIPARLVAAREAYRAARTSAGAPPAAPPAQPAE